MTLTPTTRASLLLRLRDSQDHDAWLEFVTLYEPVTYRLLRRHGLQDADARELVQDLFMAVNRSIDRWDPREERGSFRGWLQRVVRNLVINWLKRRDRQLNSIGGPELQLMLSTLPADSAAETLEFDNEVHRAMFNRAAEQVRGEVQVLTWEAFWETAVLGSSPTTAAQKLKMSVGAVRVAKCRVLARLQTAVRKMEQSNVQ